MSSSYLYVVLFAAATIVLYLLLQGRTDRKNRKKMLEAERAGLLEPASLHPVIDPNRCLGSGSCVLACPEGDVLGMIKRRAQLINPSHCIGHGACKSACPHDAITLVFGSAKRGVDIPTVSPNFETNVGGIFIAGELGGMGLIRNAVEQGRQAMEAIRKRRAKGKKLDVVIIGAGPAGFSASLAAMQHKLRYVTVEQENLGGTVSHFPRGKVVMTQPAKLPIIGKVKFTETSKEKLLAFWQEVEQRTGVKINYRERMEDITPEGDGFVVTTNRGRYETRSVLLTIGRRGTPRKLGVPGEEQGKVVYRLIDAEQYRGQHVLVVGGGDAALEAACSIADEPGTTVTLSYRSESFSRAKEKNRDRVSQAEAAGRLKVLLSSNVKEILQSSVRMDLGGKLDEFPNDAVIVCAGGILPTPFLKKIGIAVDTKFGTA
jgi:thioredoxin reductase (NADPH)